MNICAISSAAGVGAVAVIRVSGKDSISIVDNIFRGKRRLSDLKGYSMTYGNIVFEDGRVLDDVVCSVFRNPHSFTGEDSIEITIHGSLYIQQQALKILIDNGCRMALPGEFTKRAFLNGKMDLSQAEAVADLIASNSAASHHIAISQMKGGFSAELKALREKLLEFVSLIELELDFSEEEVEFAEREKLLNLIDEIKGKLKRLADSFRYGNAIKNGVPVAIIGETNVGKSTLLNWLLNEERAIVSDVHGTTRDVIEDTMQISGLLFRFIDTAGLRETTDTVESLGIKLTYKKMNEAEIVLVVIDASYNTDDIIAFADMAARKLYNKKYIVLFNKVDIISAEKRKTLEELYLPNAQAKIFISAKQNINKQELMEKLVELATKEMQEEQGVVVTNMRHYEALTKALEAIDRVNDGLMANISGEFLSRDIRDCLQFLGEITGEITNDDILGSIFSRFCVGK